LVTRKLIEEHGGNIEFSSEEGIGTTFTIHLPYEN
jgi:signal transduction histidine kinase